MIFSENRGPPSGQSEGKLFRDHADRGATERRRLRGEPTSMDRSAAIDRASSYFDSGQFLADLARRVAIPSSSQEPERASELYRYLDEEMKPALGALGFPVHLCDNPRGPPFLGADRFDD